MKYILMLKMVDEAPTIEADIKCEDCKTIIALKAALEPVKRGKWIKTDNPSSSPFVPGSEWVYICSECECAFDDDWNYCPNCGAKMEPISASTENGQEVEE